MKWPAFSPQKKLYAFCGLLLVVVVILAIDHVTLRQETVRLTRAVAAATATSPGTPDVSSGLERKVNSLDAEVSDVKYRLAALESKTHSFDEVERRISRLEVLASRLDKRMDDVADKPSTTIGDLAREIQSLKRNIDQHGRYIREIMSKVGMWLPADLLGR
ncbi:MAG TPA: hypothetical protein VMW24_24370 [Sedimentisphaerales bacterium]|nr:hypothetical protein [Sedimentisphaerales bacterium]